VPFGDDGVRDVAAGSTADEDFRAGPSGAVEDEKRERRVCAAGENRGREAGCAGAHDRGVTCASGYARDHSSAKRRRSAAKLLIIDPTPARGFSMTGGTGVGVTSVA